MIYLITGLPGNGKTLYALQWVKDKAEKEGRPVFYARIKSLTLPWTLIDPFKWYECPANSIVVIDECQQAEDPSDPKSPSLFGIRQRGAPVPRWAAELETHRHKGIDIVMITQDPMLLDSHDRKLVHLHFHIVRTFGMQRATIHEFNGCRPQVAQSRSGSIRHEWKYPKEVYDYYQSAEVHTVKARVPMRVWLFLALPFIIGAIAWYAWSRFLDPQKPSLPLSQAKAATPGTAPPSSAGLASQHVTTAEYLTSYQPRIPGLPHTAPVYDDVTKPIQAPYPAACILAHFHDPDRTDEYGRSRAACQCYSQQGTRLATPDTLCRDLANGGFFVAWNQPAAQNGPVAAPPSPTPQEPAYAGAAIIPGQHVRIGAGLPSASILTR
jgi:zona occludens toxin